MRLPIAAALAFPIALAGQTTSSGAPAESGWIESRHEHYSVFYARGYEADAQRAAAWADSVERTMRVKYGVTPRHYRISIYLHATPTREADVDNALVRCCSPAGGADSVGRIDMLTPSAPQLRSASAVSSLGLAKASADYAAKVLSSEYIPIGHYEVQNARAAGGWKYYDAPNWFVQGLQEYDAIFHSTVGNRTGTAKRLSAWAAAHQRAFTCCSPDLAISDDYNGGAAFMMFLAHEFGEAVHAKILRSSAPTFADALTDATRPYSRAELFSKLQQWLRDGAPAT